MFYDNYITIASQSDEQLYACCPLHNDDTPSFTINQITQQWYCHGCNKGGTEIQFIMHYYDVSQKIAESAYSKWEKTGEMPFPSEELVNKYHQQLLARPTEIEKLKEFGITDEAIEHYKLGWDDLRIIFPIYSRRGFCINLRKYLPPHRRGLEGDEQKIVQIKGLGDRRFYPYEAFASDPIYIVEGEKDAIVARSQGLNAVTGTGGSNIPMAEMSMFRGKTVYLMGDTDVTGQKVTAEYSRTLQGIARKIIQINLPVKDFTDYWMKYHNIDIEQYVVEVSAETKQEEEVVDNSSLSKSENVSFLNSWIRLDNMSIIGADPKTYSVPVQLKALCKELHCKKQCPIGISPEPIVVDLDPRQILQFVDATDAVQDGYLRQLFGCKYIQAEPAKLINVQKILFQESASFMEGLDDSTFEHRYGIFLYEEQRLVPTKKYNFEACRVTDPRNQQNYYVIRKADVIGIEDITYNPDDIAYFKSVADSATGAVDLLSKHYELWRSALGIEGRLDLFGGVILTYLSCTEIFWKGGVLKGWLDTMVIGDTRTGKSQLAQRFVKTLQLGGYINGENGRRTGVIGGVQRFGDSWVITWGAIPMNDKGLLIIDEASGLEVEDIKELSATRSSGAVTINKIAKGEAKARTRLLWLSNARSGKNLEDFYWKGFGAFLEFIPIVEDQARFDVVIAAAREDIAILKGIPIAPPPPVNTWRNLVSFMWSVPKENVKILPNTVLKVAELSEALEDKYGGGPLVIGVAVHEKIIRLGCAFAGLRGSVVDDNLIVTETDVEYAVEFLKNCYDKPSFDYKNYVTEHKKAQRKKKENTDYVRILCKQHPALKVLLSSNIFRGMQVKEVLGIDQLEASKLISELLARGLMSVTGSGAYAPDKMLINIVKEMQAEQG